MLTYGAWQNSLGSDCKMNLCFVLQKIRRCEYHKCDMVPTLEEKNDDQIVIVKTLCQKTVVQYVMIKIIVQLYCE